MLLVFWSDQRTKGMHQMKIGPVVHNTLARSVAERLLKLIADGSIKPGAKMPSERELMDKLKVARSTVREALQTLAAVSVVEIRPGIGTFVNDNAKELIPSAQRALQESKETPPAQPSHSRGNGSERLQVTGLVPLPPAPEKPVHIPNLKKDRLATFDFISWWERDKVQGARVMVVGAGALGNEVLKNLALMGVGNLFIVDFDTIEAANLSRSVLFRADDNGQKKAEVAARRVKELNPDVHVQYFHGDVNTALGLGIFRRMDAIIGCLDNREARLSINRFAYHLNKPWVDGAIQELFGLVRVFVPGQGACYECTLTEQARREMSLRYSCPLLARQNILLGKVPTTPTISGIVGGMQSQEALKLIHAMPVNAGQVTHVNGLTNEFHTTAYTPDEDCESHWIYGEITEMADRKASTTTVAEMLRIARESLGADASLELDQEIVLSLECHNCETNTEVFKPISQVDYNDGLCPGCGELREVHMTHVVDGSEPFLNRTLLGIGIPPLHIVRARNANEYGFFELTGDLADTLHWAHFEGGARSPRAARVRLHTRPQIKLGEVMPDEPIAPAPARPRLVVH
jgi:molybdopterin/thiamine biosynthesis adenylyltransferase/DNA-binding transcriptional regulator YhcF (GntR family)